MPYNNAICVILHITDTIGTPIKPRSKMNKLLIKLKPKPNNIKSCDIDIEHIKMINTLLQRGIDNADKLMLILK